MEQHENIDSKFRLVILAAKRARQLLRGGRKKIDMEAENPLTVALEEINRGLVHFEITDGTPREPDLSIFGDGDGKDEGDLDELDGGGDDFEADDGKEDDESPDEEDDYDEEDRDGGGEDGDDDDFVDEENAAEEEDSPDPAEDEEEEPAEE